MTSPRPIGTTAKVVLESVEEALATNNDLLFGLVEVMFEDRELAFRLLYQASSKNTMALRALTLLRADRLRDAENVVMDSRLKERRP